jgi:hypothetical protein
MTSWEALSPIVGGVPFDEHLLVCVALQQVADGVQALGGFRGDLRRIGGEVQRAGSDGDAPGGGLDVDVLQAAGLDPLVQVVGDRLVVGARLQGASRAYSLRT